MKKDVKKVIKDKYGTIASGETGCGASPSACCGSSAPGAVARSIGYDEDDLRSVPEGANLGLGCGNPTAFGMLKPGQTVVDLGSGAGMDCFLAARRVGPRGRVIGIDMTPEMIQRARRNAERAGCRNVEFELGEIEKIPLEDEIADVVISNCVINLSPDKPAVFNEAYRILKKGGSLVVSDIVLLRPLPRALAENMNAYVGCIAGASLRSDYLGYIDKAGFERVEILGEFPYTTTLLASDPVAKEILDGLTLSQEELRAAASSVMSITLRARK